MLLSSFISTVAAFLGVANAACNYGTVEFPREPNVPTSKFSYAGLTGPLNWYGLNETTNVMCDKGTHQSPIDIGTYSNNASLANGSDVNLKIPSYPGGAEFENLGTNVEVVVNGTLVDANKMYSLAQFHFHTPSEHRINDEYYPMEIHFVLQAADKSMAVIGFLIDFGPTDPLLSNVFASIDEIPLPGNVTMTAPLDFSTIEYQLAHDTVYRYTGSLTTPPCSEEVNWIIGNKPLYIDVDTFKKVKKVVKFNARYTQDGLGQVNLLENAAEELNV